MFLSPWDEMFLTVPASRAPRLWPCRRSSTPVRVPKRPLWMESSINSLNFKLGDDGREGLATVKLPRGVTCDDVELDFSEATRTLTIRLGSWSQRFRLSKGFDTTQMQADFDPVRSELRILAPRQHSGPCRSRSASEVESDECSASERERTPSPSRDRARKAKRCHPEAVKLPAKKPEVTIEDVGPEEELDY